MKIKFQDIEVGLDLDPEKGLADNGDLESDLLALLTVTGEAAKAADKAIVLCIDELQCVEEEQLAVLITCLHRTSQLSLPCLDGERTLARCKRWCASYTDFKLVLGVFS